jgi:enamine deaminase RidA (YjgF/YER057c/UK114 family)
MELAAQIADVITSKFVNGDVDFKDHSAVANGASDLIAEVFGDAGKHARAAVGSGSLPFGVVVEVDAQFNLILHRLFDFIVLTHYGLTLLSTYYVLNI